MRKSYVQCPKTLKLIPKDKYFAKPPQTHMVMPDIAEYRNIIDGEVISSRSQHREFLRKHDLVEVGNEKESFSKYQGKTRENHEALSNRKYREQLRRDLSRAFD